MKTWFVAADLDAGRDRLALSIYRGSRRDAHVCMRLKYAEKSGHERVYLRLNAGPDINGFYMRVSTAHTWNV
jgi:hypothetical protein